MTIAYILSSTDPYGGATKSFLMMLKDVVRMGVTPVIILPDHNGICHELEENGHEVHVIPFRPNAFPRIKAPKNRILFIPKMIGRIGVNFLATKKLEKLLKNRGVDIIHTNVSVVKVGYLCAKRLHIPHIYHVREYIDADFNIHYFPTQASIRKQFRQPFSHTICITKDIQRHHQLHNLATSRVIYNGITPRRTDMPHGGSHDFFLYAGRIEPAKGLRELIEAYAVYVSQVDKPFPLHVAGRVIHQQYYEQTVELIRDKQIESLVCFLGERSDIDQLMQQARAIIIPSRLEGFGRCMAEAMFNGCLAIGRNTGGTKEQFDNGRQLEHEEIALRYENTEELTNCLMQVAANYDDFQSYLTRAFHTVNTLYSQETNTEQVCQFYNDIVCHKD